MNNFVDQYQNNEQLHTPPIFDLSCFINFSFFFSSYSCYLNSATPSTPLMLDNCFRDALLNTLDFFTGLVTEAAREIKTRCA